MSGIKRERWTEAEVQALPAGEHDFFDRKSGGLLASSDFRRDLAKALSAFANSGGGHIILGMSDDGTFDGVPPLRGRTPTREWLEQITPDLLSYPLEDFRVHEVEAASPSTIPYGTVAIVIDVGDSALAPHQATAARTYYSREGGHSKPAPHFYLEMLRNRLVRPSLEPELIEIRATRAHAHEGGIFVEMVLNFRIRNTGRVAAYKWALSWDQISGHRADREADYRYSFASFPNGSRSRNSSVRLDDTILPSLALTEQRDFGVHLRPVSIERADVESELRLMIPPELTVHFRAVSETSPGEPHSKALTDLFDYPKFVDSMFPLR